MISLKELLKRAGWTVDRDDGKDLRRYDAERIRALCEGWLAMQDLKATKPMTKTNL